jgi:DASS family divalent anion:Na+ symporter
MKLDSLWRWAGTIGAGVVIAALPPPDGVTRQSWLLLAIFISTIVGSMLQPLTGSAVVLLGIAATVITGALDPTKALKGHSDPVVWLVLAAFFLSCGMVKTGLGRRIALLLIRAIGKRSLGLGYSLVASDFILASMIPSNGARSGGIMLPVACSIAEAYDSRPDDGTAGRLGSYLMNLLYQADVIICATFITGQAANLVIAKLVAENSTIQLNYLNWFAAGIVPGLLSLIAVPFMIYRFFPPEIKKTPEAAEFASNELRKMGRFSAGEMIMLGTLISVVAMWIAKDRFHSVDTSIVALLGVCLLLLTRVVEWKDLMGERNAWSVFIWYGGLVNMATELGNTGITKIFADKISGLTTGMTWAVALAVLLAIYFYSHYFFASITAHVLAMLVPFLAATLAVGAPAGLAVLFLMYFSNLNASLTHFGTTPGPIYFGTGYVKQGQWWTIGLIASFINIAIWSTVGLAWWKLLGWW